MMQGLSFGILFYGSHLDPSNTDSDSTLERLEARPSSGLDRF